jgi:ProP effector
VKVQRTPEEKAAFQAAQAELQRQAAIQKQALVIAVENALRSAFPAAFPERHLPPVPLLIGIHRQLRAVTADRFSAAILKVFLQSWTRQSPYVSAIADGVARHDLQGNPVGAPTEKEIALAKREMAKRHAAQKAGDV